MTTKKLSLFSSLFIALSASLALGQAVLFNENWDNGMTGWDRTDNGAGYLVAITDHPDNPGVNVLGGIKVNANDNKLAYLQYTDGVQLQAGDLQLGVAMTFTTQLVSTSTQYIRFGLGTGEESNREANAYFMDFGRGGVTLGKNWASYSGGDNNKAAKIDNVTYAADPVTPTIRGSFETYTILLQIVGEGLKVSLWHDGIEKLSWIDSLPLDFDDVVYPFIGLRIHADDPIGEGMYVSNLSVSVIPESSTTVLSLLSAFALMALWIRYKKR